MCSRVLSRFVRKSSSGATLPLRLQEVTPTLLESAIDLFVKHFFRDEPWSKAAGITQNPRAVAEARAIFEKKMASPLFSCTICCEDKDDSPDKVLGVLALELKKSTDSCKSEQVETMELRKYVDIIQTVSEMYDPLVKLKVPCFYQDIGLVVAPEYRSMGIAKELIKACKIICKQSGVPLVGAAMTSSATQKVAAEENWVTVAEVDFQELGRLHGVAFPHTPATVKYMIGGFQ